MCWTGDVKTIRIDRYKDCASARYRVRVHRGGRPLLYRYYPDYKMALIAAHEFAANYEKLTAPIRYDKRIKWTMT
jgi:hypothetical protein